MINTTREIKLILPIHFFCFFFPFFVLRHLKTPLGNTTESSRVGSHESDTNHSDLTLKATSVAEPTERNCSPKNTLTGN
jgi:hypothetical protein